MSIETVHIRNKSGKQDIRIPEHLRIDDDRAYLKKTGNSITIIPYHEPWKNLIESLDLFTPDFMENRYQPEPENRDIFE